MKTWLILLYLATSTISSLTQVAHGRTNEAGSHLRFQNAGTEEPTLEQITSANSKGCNKRWWEQLWSIFSKEKDCRIKEDGLLPSQNDETDDPDQQGPMDTSSNIFGGGFIPVRLKLPSFSFSQHSQVNSDENVEDNAGETMNTLEEKKEPQEGNHEKEDVEAAFPHVTEPATINPATTKPGPTPKAAEETVTEPPGRCQPRSNLGATCNMSTAEDKVKLAGALTEFALKFYATAIQYEKPHSNVIFSPISISSMFSNLLLGARGETEVRLEKLLSYTEDLTCIHASLRDLCKSEALASASALFHQPALSLNNDFLDLSDEFYKTKIKHLSNNSKQDVIDINAWVSQNTDNKIKKLLNSLEPDVQMVLLNAVFFQSKWKTAFQAQDTSKEIFYPQGLPSIRVPMMTSQKYPVASFFDHNLQAKVGRLQLSHNMSLVIIMPRSMSQNLSVVEDRLDADVFKAVMTKLESIPFKPTVVALPKFKVDSSQDLMSIIGEMDFGIFYDANLCGISKGEDVVLSSAQHKAVLEINEEGVEGAAATSVSLARTANYFEARQPFIFMVWTNDHFPIFLGRINNPKSS